MRRRPEPGPEQTHAYDSLELEAEFRRPGHGLLDTMTTIRQGDSPPRRSPCGIPGQGAHDHMPVPHKGQWIRVEPPVESV